MKAALSVLAVLLASHGMAQAPLIPGIHSFEQKWIREEAYTMNWYMKKDTALLMIGAIETTVIPGTDQLVVVTEVTMKGAKSPWIDSTIADRSTLSPIRHSSYNVQRDMVLNFGKVVTGYYFDKMTNKHTEISDTALTAYFDSNLYPMLINWLPLEEGYTRDIAIYDYNPAGTIGVLQGHVLEVKAGDYKSPVSGNHPVWVVKVQDEIARAISYYYIDKGNRSLWKQQISMAGREMVMERAEEK